MPELPEVETIKKGLSPYLEKAWIKEVIIRQGQLRWPITSGMSGRVSLQQILTLSRRGKYLLIHLNDGAIIIHLGMSGTLRYLAEYNPPQSPHDHVDIVLADNAVLRYHDPRRFGAILWCEGDPLAHPLLRTLGMEPLSPQFTGHYLERRACNRRLAIKLFIMDNKVVTGIGNIYATEALFLARIHPTTPVSLLSPNQWQHLVDVIRQVLQAAIQQGGTTIKDFTNSEGKLGYFVQRLQVYGRDKLPCLVCGQPLQSMRLGQRATVFCNGCQPCVQNRSVMR